MNGPRILPFLRYAEKDGGLPNRDFVYAYDCRLIYCLKGCGSLTFEQSVYPLTAGTLCLYPSGTKYLPQRDESDPMRFIILNFDYYPTRPDLTAPLSPVSEDDFDPAQVIDSWKDTEEPCFTEPQVLPDFQTVENELLELVREWQVKKLHYQEAASSLLSLVLYRVLQRSSVGAESGARADERWPLSTGILPSDWTTMPSLSGFTIIPII